MPAPIPPARVAAELGRLGLNEWEFIRECSRAEKCDVNVCPLDPLIGFRDMDPSDRETRCPMPKPTRERYFSRLKPEMQALLPFGGLFEAEWNRREASRRRSAALTTEQRARMQAGREKGMAAIKEARLKALANLTEAGAGQGLPGPG